MAQQSGLERDSNHLTSARRTCKLVVGVQPENDILQALVADWTCLEDITLFSLSLHSCIHTCNVCVALQRGTVVCFARRLYPVHWSFGLQVVFGFKVMAYKITAAVHGS